MKNEHHVIDTEKHLQSGKYLKKHQNKSTHLLALARCLRREWSYIFTDCAQVSEEPAKLLLR